MKNRLAGASFVLALLAAGFLLMWPVCSGFNGVQRTRGTLLQVNGPYILIPVLLPVLTALIALLLRKQVVRFVAAILMALFVVLGGFTIGLFYLPAGILMLLASCVDQSSQFRDLR